jgi:hypothetical protein
MVHHVPPTLVSDFAGSVDFPFAELTIRTGMMAAGIGQIKYGG